jgi:hypothetical protein
MKAKEKRARLQELKKLPAVSTVRRGGSEDKRAQAVIRDF